MICIHPRVAANLGMLAKLQMQTGMRAVIGGTYARLVSPSAAAPAPVQTLAAAPRHNAGHRNLLTCTFCETRSNAQLAGDDCWRCKKGVMSDGFGGNGGSAA